MNCISCHEPIPNNSLLCCVICKQPYHYQCVDVTNEHYEQRADILKLAWICTGCKNVTMARPSNTLDMSLDEISTEVAAFHQQNTSQLNNNKSNHQEVPPNTQVSLESFKQLLDQNKSDILDKMDDIKMDIMKRVKVELNIVTEKIKADFNESIDYLSTKIQGLEGNITTLETRVMTLESENKKLKSQVLTLNTSTQESMVIVLRDELNERDQVLLLNDVEISGIPENEGESITHIVTLVAKKLNVNFTVQDIVSAERAGRTSSQVHGSDPGKSSVLHDGQQSGGAGAAVHGQNQVPRPRPIVVRFARRTVRDELLKQARVRRGVTTEGLGLPPHSYKNIYINERLTKFNRQLFGKARETAKLLGWRFSWTRDGKVFVRRTDTSKVHRLRCTNDIERVLSPITKNQSI
ncbi:hypothetical protein O0L34_g10314 [Tuta absoluta]|nr:hypothetical protein O0L34_g10314 [Tuta absoluta]